MEKENTTNRQENKQKRKTPRRDGRSQSMMTFRLDNELKEFLTQVKNKGRLINKLLEQEAEKWRNNPEWEENEDERELTDPYRS